MQRQPQSPRASGGGRGAVIQRMIPTTADGWKQTRYETLQNAQEWAAFLTEIDEDGNTFEAEGSNVEINGKAFTYTLIRDWINIAPDMLKQTCDKTRAARQAQSQPQVGGYMPSSYPASSGYPQYPGYQPQYPHAYPQYPTTYGNYPMGAPQQQSYPPSYYAPTQYFPPQFKTPSPYVTPTQSNYQQQPLPGHMEAKATSSVSSSFQPKPTVSSKQLIVQTEIMTGDMYVIMQALKMTPYTYVLLLHGSSGKESTAASIIQFYKECLKGQYDQKVFTEKVGDVDATRKYLTQAAYNKRERSPIKSFSPEGEKLFAQYTALGYELYAPGIASSISAKNYKGFREAITDSEDIERFFDYFEKLGIQKGKPYIVVWSRLSGKRGGLHPESDTSRTGNLSIIEAIKKQFPGTGIIAAGDTPNKGYAVEGVIDLTEFWGANKNPKFPGSGRKDQLLMWIALDKFTGGIKHVGMRSGAIEAMPSLGMKTVMILDKGNAQMPRSEKLKSIEDFRLAQVNKLATRKGKYWQQNPDILKLPTPTRPGEEQKGSLQRGFDEPDLKTIMDALNS